MPYCTFQLALLASVLEELEQEIKDLVRTHVSGLVEVAMGLLVNELTPEASFRFEEELGDAGRELLRKIAEWAYNHCETEDHESMPSVIRFEGGEYRRQNNKTPNRDVSTRFGKITLWRFPYRYRQREREPGIFPLELLLGLTQGATAALADSAARYMAETGASQSRVLERLRREHNIGWGAERLRAVIAAKAQAMDAFRHVYQVARVLEFLEKAYESSGKCKPVLAIGRDGISVCRQPKSPWEVASVATVTVYNRSGHRLGTVYLAQMPEQGQGELTGQLTQLICDILQRWNRPLPRLCYVTDAGANETGFYRKVLLNLRHPRRPTRKLRWYRIVDYYHATERITTMADCLFGKDSKRGKSWAHRMRKLLLKPSGPSRVLHSAAALVAKKRRMGRQRREKFDTAYNYIRRRTRYMDYHEYRARHLPIGSGVTEAACKTVFTQRMKLSGMRWKADGGQAVLDLRVLLLSNIWESVRDAALHAQKHHIIVPHYRHDKHSSRIAA